MASDTTKPLKPVAVPFKSSVVNVPHPVGITAPENENPRTVDPPGDTVNPASAAAPPEEPLTVAPSTLNWNPAISAAVL